MPELQPMVLWVDASCYEDQELAAVAVVDRTKKVVASQLLRSCRSSMGAEIEAVKLGLRFARYMRLPVELRTDSTGAAKALTPPRGVSITWVRRHENLADGAAHALAVAAISERS